MSSAKVIIKEQDRSAIVPSMNGIYAGITIVADKGPVGKPFLITSENQLIDVFGTPNPRLGVAHYSAMNYLSQGNKLWVVRAAHEDAKYAGVLVRSKISPIPQERTASLSTENLIVCPLADGLTQQELNAYQFPVYLTNKLYEKSDATVFEDVINSDEVRVSSFEKIKVGDSISFSTLTLEQLNDPTTEVGEDTLTYVVSELITRQLSFDNMIVEDPINVVKGAKVLKVTNGGAATIEYPGNPTVKRSASNTTNILVDNADYIAPGDTIDINGVRTVFNEKNLYTEEAKVLKLNNLLSVTTDQTIFEVVQSEFEDRDAFLVTAANQGAWGNHLSIGITPSKNYDTAFNILVYYKGVLVESWEVTRDNSLDGFGRQLNLEQKINGKSAYIMVFDNPNDVDNDGVPQLPLNTDYSLWRMNPEDVFVETEIKITENLLKGHLEVKLTGVQGLTLGTRLKFLIDDDITLSKEYKVLSMDSLNNTVILDRRIEESQISKTWIDNNGNSVDTVIYVFDADNNSSENGIVDGVQYYAIDRISNVYYNYRLNSRFVISGVEGSLLSAGANMTAGGSLGSAVTVGDLITAVKMLSNKESTPVTLLMDGGFAIPAYAQAIQEVCESQGLTHGYLSSDPASEEGVNYLNDIVEYKNSTNLNTHLCSMFVGWIKVYDEYNQLEVWVSPEGFAAASQSMVTRNYNIFQPAAGWNNGKVLGLDVKVKFSEGDRDFLVDNRLNPIRYKEGSGLVIWGNETLLVKPSPMQLRSVAMLLIAIKTGLEGMLEFKTFELNNERTWSTVEGTLEGFMRDEIKGKGGVYNYSLAVTDVITPSDIDNRRMPVFLGIQPTMDIKEIPVTLAIFNSSVDIQVAL